MTEAAPEGLRAKFELIVADVVARCRATGRPAVMGVDLFTWFDATLGAEHMIDLRGAQPVTLDDAQLAACHVGETAAAIALDERFGGGDRLAGER